MTTIETTAIETASARLIVSRVAAIHTDGSCLGNPGPGGYAAVVEIDGERRVVSGGDPATTNNRMEMMAAVAALESLEPGCDVTVYADSAYLVGGMTRWLAGWKANGWRTADKQPVKNRDLWERLEIAASRHRVAWVRVAGHADVPGNLEADAVAAAEARRAAKRA